MLNRKALVFLRGNNDIDHIVPVLYKWLKLDDVFIHVLITTLPDYLNDYRINFLRQFKNINIHFIADFLSEGPMKKRLESATSQSEKAPPLKKLYDILRKTFKLKAREYTPSLSYPDPLLATTDFIKQIFDKIFDKDDKGILIFDWIMAVDFVKLVLDKAKASMFPTISLPHGDIPYYNLLENLNDLNYERLDSYRRSGAIFDYLVVPNQLCARRYNRFMGPDRLKILGSPRYNDEWLGIMSNLIPEYRTEAGADKLKIAFFLRPMDYSIHWDEVIRTIKLVVQFSEVHLVVKHHTRKASVKKLIQSYPELYNSKTSNLEYVFDEVNSGALIKWADIILDLGTSATFEAVRYGKPVLAMEYMQANYLTISHYMPCCEMKCRDDVYNTIQAFITDRNSKFYDEKERNRFIKEVIGGPDLDILEGYVKFLNGCLDMAKP